MTQSFDPDRFFGQQVLADGFIYTVSDFYHENTLTSEYEARKNAGGFAEDEVAMVSADICGGLEHLHSFKPPITYRALVMDTVLLGADGHWKLSDFRCLQFVVSVWRHRCDIYLCLP